MGFKKFTDINEDVDVTQLMPQNGPHNAQPQPEQQPVAATASQPVAKPEAPAQEVEKTEEGDEKVQINVSTHVIGQPDQAAQPQTEPAAEVTVSEPAKFISKLFESREVAHIYHLQAKGEQGSYAAHKALEDYYENVFELIDDLVEVYQGQYDIIEGYENIDLKEVENDRIQYFISVGEFIKQTRYSAILQEDAHLQAIIDEILILVYKTLYKLRFNK